jgi:hypothetical protein
MELSKFIESFVATLTFLYAFTGLIINAVERGVANSQGHTTFSERYSGSTESAIKNIFTDPVINLSVVDTSLNQRCPLGSTSAIYTWKTSEVYCQCSSSVTRSSCYRRPSCNTNNASSFEMSTWKNKKICLNRIKNTDWSYATAEGTQGCPANFKRCPGAICVNKSHSECPINDLIVSKDVPTVGNVIYTNISYFNKEGSIFVARNAAKTPLLSLEVEIVSAPCINTKLSPKRSNGRRYAIIVNKLLEKKCINLIYLTKGKGTLRV